MTIRDLEDAVADAVTNGWAQAVNDVRSSILSLWSARGETLTAQEVSAILSRLVLPGPVNAVELLLPAVFYGDSAITGATTPMLDDAAVEALDGVETKAPEGIAETRNRLKAASLDTLPDLLTTIQPLSTSVSEMRATASWATNTAANSATEAAAQQMGTGVIWVPERDACVRCTSYAGQTSINGGSFGPSQAFGDSLPTLPFPPLHPHCRCQLQEWNPNDAMTPLVLRREAVRSILRGYSLPSESVAARLRAARTALDRGYKAPVSVKSYARRAVERGKFNTRKVP